VGKLIDDKFWDGYLSEESEYETLSPEIILFVDMKILSHMNSLEQM